MTPISTAFLLYPEVLASLELDTDINGAFEMCCLRDSADLTVAAPNLAARLVSELTAEMRDDGE